jgi:15-cis-phytoene desaturase
MSNKPKRSVAVLGGGVAGMSAAHELAERGFRVTVFEAAATQGGKARSIFVPNTGTDGRRDLPGEHGFRFFPSFYRHMPDTMKRIPYGRRTVHDNLHATSRTMFAREGQVDPMVLTRFPRSMEDVQDLLRLRFSDFDLTFEDYRSLARHTWILLTSCKERREHEFDEVRWWDFIGAEQRSANFQKMLGDVSVRFLLAMDARRASTKTIGTVGLQLWLDHFKPGMNVDRLLNGPTHDVWLSPWLAHLRNMGVDYRLNSRVEHIRCQDDRIVEVTVRNGADTRYTFSADFFVCAVPVERMLKLVDDEMKEVEPRLAHLDKLHTDWMSGLQFFLDRDVTLANGHIVMNDCPWALTAISQKQFWPDVDLSRFGNGKVDGILSVAISNWDAVGDQCCKTARDCTEEEIVAEVWEELKRHLNDSGEVHLEDHNVVHTYLADSCHRCNGKWVNEEPLLINTAGSWKHRPPAVTNIHNFFLASDYVQTNTDVATMESANEAARRAVNGILDATGSPASKCVIWDHEEPFIFEPLKRIDRELFLRGFPHPMYSSGVRKPENFRARKPVPWSS